MQGEHFLHVAGITGKGKLVLVYTVQEIYNGTKKFRAWYGGDLLGTVGHLLNLPIVVVATADLVGESARDGESRGTVLKCGQLRGSVVLDAATTASKAVFSTALHWATCKTLLQVGSMGTCRWAFHHPSSRGHA